MLESQKPRVTQANERKIKKQELNNPLKQLKYNGIKPKLDTTIKYQTMYIFESKK